MASVRLVESRKVHVSEVAPGAAPVVRIQSHADAKVATHAGQSSAYGAMNPSSTLNAVAAVSSSAAVVAHMQNPSLYATFSHRDGDAAAPDGAGRRRGGAAAEHHDRRARGDPDGR